MLAAGLALACYWEGSCGCCCFIVVVWRGGSPLWRGAEEGVTFGTPFPAGLAVLLSLLLGVEGEVVFGGVEESVVSAV